jgi:hypothetical protein
LTAAAQRALELADQKLQFQFANPAKICSIQRCTSVGRDKLERLIVVCAACDQRFLVNCGVVPTVQAWAWLAVPQQDPTTVLDFPTRRIAPMLLYLLAIPTVPARLFGRRPIRYPVAEAQWDQDHARRQI